MRNFGFYIFVVILLGALGSSCLYFVYLPAPSGPPVHFILPDGWQGKFKLALNKAGGIQIDLKNDCYTYRIPEIGVLRVKSFAPFKQWHGITMAFEGGVSIPDELHPGRLPDTVAFHVLSTTGSGEHWYMIGTEDERKAAYEEKTWDWKVGNVAHDTEAESEGLGEPLSDVQGG
ncbi:MAG: hypothetical protein IIC01_09350 [Planctomycetes bacterium]|nr:hypothetical protein [Planctomycetota bacterium]